jgi:hypothetical protein
MSDFESKLPIRLYAHETAGDTFESVRVSTAGELYVKTEMSLFDMDTAGGSALDYQPAVGLLYGDAGGAVLVTADNPLPVSATLTSATEYTDKSTFTITTGKVGAVGFYVDEIAPGTLADTEIGIPRMTADRKILVRVAGATDAYRMDVDVNGYAQVKIADHNVTSTKPIAISKDNSANTELNPIFVQMAAGVSGAEKHNYDTTVNVAKFVGSDNHDLAVTGGNTFLLKRVLASASGAMKVVVQTGPLATLATIAVAFTSTANPNADIEFTPPLEVPSTSTGTIRVIRYNRDNQDMDVYSTIMGTEV